MGVPYSKQINAALEQVNPLVEAGFETLQTIKRIAYLLSFIQVVTVILLSLIFLTMLGILITVHPDLERERDILVTPSVKFVADIILWIKNVGGAMVWWISGSVVLGCAVGATWATWLIKRDPTLNADEVTVPEGKE